MTLFPLLKRLNRWPAKLVGVVLLLLLASWVFMHDVFEDEQKQAVTQAIKLHWEQPNQPVEVLAVAVEKEFAIADWIQGERGGRAVLRKNNEDWQTLACGDAQIKNAQTLTQYGLSLPQAQAIVQQLQLEEQHIPAEKLQLIDEFSNVVDMRHHLFHH